MCHFELVPPWASFSLSFYMWVSTPFPPPPPPPSPSGEQNRTEQICLFGVLYKEYIDYFQISKNYKFLSKAFVSTTWKWMSVLFRTWKMPPDPTPDSERGPAWSGLHPIFKARQSRSQPVSNCRRWLCHSSSIYRPVRIALQKLQVCSWIAQKTAGHGVCFWESQSSLAFCSPTTLSPRIQDLRIPLHWTAPIRLFLWVEDVPISISWHWTFSTCTCYSSVGTPPEGSPRSGGTLC